MTFVRARPPEGSDLALAAPEDAPSTAPSHAPRPASDNATSAERNHGTGRSPSYVPSVGT
jgi:hypothetical protein